MDTPSRDAFEAIDVIDRALGKYVHPDEAPMLVQSFAEVRGSLLTPVEARALSKLLAAMEVGEAATLIAKLRRIAGDS